MSAPPLNPLIGMLFRLPVRQVFLAMPAEVAGLRARTVRQDYLIAELRHALYGKRSGPLDPGALVRHGGLPSGPGRQPDAGASQAIKPALHGRDPRPGTLTGPGKTRAGQNQGRAKPGPAIPLGTDPQ